MSYGFYPIYTDVWLDRYSYLRVSLEQQQEALELQRAALEELRLERQLTHEKTIRQLRYQRVRVLVATGMLVLTFVGLLHMNGSETPIAPTQSPVIVDESSRYGLSRVTIWWDTFGGADMAMSNENRTAVVQGQSEASAIKEYLAAVTVPEQLSRVNARALLEEVIAFLDWKARTERDPLARVELIQARIDAQRAIDDLDRAGDVEALEAGFVEHAASYSRRKGITWTA